MCVHVCTCVHVCVCDCLDVGWMYVHVCACVCLYVTVWTWGVCVRVLVPLTSQTFVPASQLLRAVWLGLRRVVDG